MSEKLTELNVVKLTARGVRNDRVMRGEAGMTFIVDSVTVRSGIGLSVIYHVRDYRYASDAWGAFCIWSLAPGDYEEVDL